MEKDVELHRQPGCWLRSSHTFKECVIAHWSSGSAPKITGAQICYRSYGLILSIRGRGALYTGRSYTVRSGGLYTRENVGMSSERQVRILPAENLRFPGEGSSAQGKSGPKARPRGVVDGQQVDIPVPAYVRSSDREG